MYFENQKTILYLLSCLLICGDECPTVKYVDDTTIYRVTNDTQDQTLQSAVSVATKWSQRNNMKINASKTKEMLITFSKTPPAVPLIEVNGIALERVSTCTLLAL